MITCVVNCVAVLKANQQQRTVNGAGAAKETWRDSKGQACIRSNPETSSRCSLYGLQQGYLAAYVVRCLLLIVHSSTPCSVFLSSSKTVDCCSTACRKLRPWYGISIWTTRDSSISGWQSLSIARIHTAKPQNQSERGTSLTAKRGRPEIESPRGQFTNHSLLPPAPHPNSSSIYPQMRPPPPLPTRPLTNSNEPTELCD